MAPLASQGGLACRILDQLLATSGRAVQAGESKSRADDARSLPKLCTNPGLRDDLQEAISTLEETSPLRDNGRGKAGALLVSTWVQFFASLEAPLQKLLSPNRGLFENAPEPVKVVAIRSHCQASADAADAAALLLIKLDQLERHLANVMSSSSASSPEGATLPVFIAGGIAPTVADIAGSVALVNAFHFALPPRLRSGLCHVIAWLKACLQSAAIGEVLRGGPDMLDFVGWSAEEEQLFIKNVVQAKDKQAGMSQSNSKMRCSTPSRTTPNRVPSSSPGSRQLEASHARRQPEAVVAQAPSAGEQERKATGIRGTARNSESLDPSSTLVRPAMRVCVCSRTSGTASRYPSNLSHDDVVILPDFFCTEEDRSLYESLLEEMSAVQSQGNANAAWVKWHEGCHSITKAPAESATYQSIVKQLCDYFNVEPQSMSTRFNWYQDSSDWKPLHHDSAAFNPERARVQNITIGASFGREREMAFKHAQQGTLVYFPQKNGSVFTFGRDVNISWKHGINALPEEQQDCNGRISIILWGWVRDATEEAVPRPLAAAPRRRTAAASLAPAKAVLNRAAETFDAESLAEQESLGGLGFSSFWQWCQSCLAAPCFLESLGHYGAAETGLDIPAAVASSSFSRQRVVRFAHDDHHGQRRGGRGATMADPWHRGQSDPWAASSSSIAKPTSQAKAADPWSLYGSAKPGSMMPREGSRLRRGPRESNGVEEGMELDREAFISQRIDFRLQLVVRELSLTDSELRSLGSKHFKDQAQFLEAVAGEAATNLMSAAESMEPPRERRPDRFWWKEDMEKLCFDLVMTPELELVEGAPALSHWWDAELLAESEHFFAIFKPANMRVTTDDHGLWEASPTNFIHVAHQRVAMPLKSDDMAQRGICHRLDKDTSGVQFFAKSMEGCEHFMRANQIHSVQKEYLALVVGKLGDEAGSPLGLLDLPLVKWQDPMRGEFGSVICADHGMPACTKYKALRQWYVPAKGRLAFWGEGRWFTLVQLRILTGRTHQIRVHMAFTGHPLVGDAKYSPGLYEQDCAIAQRIFLHCTRMEFKDMDDRPVLGASDLPADLQASLLQIHRLAEVASDNCQDPQGGQDGLRSLPGLTAILRLSEKYAIQAVEPSVGAEHSPSHGEDTRTTGARQPAGDAGAIVHRCYHCGQQERAQRRVLQRGKQRAMLWTLERAGCFEADQEIEVGGGSRQAWGPNCLWVPTELQMRARRHGISVARDNSQREDVAEADELGDGWGDHGAEWTWAHDGARQNGWIRLLSGSLLVSRWGAGSWGLLPVDGEPPLLLITFNGVEHALRLCSDTSQQNRGAVRFEVVSKRRLSEEISLFQDVDQHAHLAEAEPVCPTQGWPDPCAELNMPTSRRHRD